MRTIGVLAGLVMSALPALAQVEAGKEQTVLIPSMGTHMKVYAPSNYTTDRVWPVIFFYHGAGGRPDTGFLRSHTGGRDFVIVGMPYAESGVPRRTPEQQRAYVLKERDQLRAAAGWMISNAHADRSRVYLAGASKGGWHVGMLAQQDVGNLGGLIILIGGCSREAAKKPGMRFRKMPVYIGVGETDGGFVPSVRARDYYRKNGAFVTFEIYEGLGHQTPGKIPLLAAWLEAQARYARASVDLQNELRREMGARYKEILAMTDGGPRYRALRAFANDPRLPFCGATTHRTVRDRIGQIAAASPAKDEWHAEQTFGQLVWQETTMRRLRDLEKVAVGMRGLGDAYGHTLYGKAAQRCVGPIEAAYAKSVEATEKASAEAGLTRPKPRPVGTVVPAFPTFTRPSAHRPVRDGNRIIFKPNESGKK